MFVVYREEIAFRLSYIRRKDTLQFCDLKEFFYFWTAYFTITMKKICLSLILLLGIAPLFAQNQGVIHHERGEDLQQYLLDSVKFVVPEFQSGIITFQDGSYSRGPVNISTIEQRVYFIATNGEKQVLTNEDQVSRVSIKGRTFIKSKYGYVELLATEGDIALGAVRRVSFFETEKKGAYGMVSQTTSVTTIGSLQQNGTMYTLGIDQNTPFKYSVSPYLYKNSRIYLSNKKNFLKCFPDKKAEIEQYLKDNNVDFEKLEDVEALFNALK